MVRRIFENLTSKQAKILVKRMMERSMCHNCPHRKTHEGGVAPSGVPEVQMNSSVVYLTDYGPVHPCHNDLSSPCKGHTRDLKREQEGEEKNGDLITFNLL